MQRRFLLSSPPSLLLSLLLLLVLSSFHGMLVTAQDFNFATGKIDADSLTSLQHASLDSSGSLTLDSSAGDARAFYGQPISLLDRAGVSVLSFSSFFTFASNVTTGNGTIALAFTPNATADVAEARKTVTVEFNTSCSTGADDGSRFYGGHGYQGRGGGYWGGHGGGGRFGGFGGFGVFEYANGSNLIPQRVDGYGPGWTGQPPQGPYFCNQNFSNPTLQYLVAIEYNASTDTISVGSPSCGSAMALTTQFPAQNLSGIITKPVYVGFFVSGGGVYNISQWNFTSNTNTSSVANLAVSNIASTTPSSGSSDGGNDGMRRSNGGLKKGYVIAFSVLGAAIGVAAVLLVCCLCARRRTVTSARFVAKSRHEGTIPESAVVFDAKKPNAPPAKVLLVERDTMPLNTHPNSASNGSTGAASWLQPVHPR